jgi:large subunit ribosomal protein L43
LYGTFFPLQRLGSFSTIIVNNNEKVIPLNGFEVTAIAKKVQLLLDSSGAKIKPLKRRTVESTAESTRGIWSGLHVDDLFKI